MHVVRSLMMLLCLGLINPGLSNAETEVAKPEQTASLDLTLGTEARCQLGTESCLQRYDEIVASMKSSLGTDLSARVDALLLGLSDQHQGLVVIDLSWDIVKTENGYLRIRGGTDKGAFTGSLYRLSVLGIADIRGALDLSTASQFAYDVGAGVDFKYEKLTLRAWVDEAAASGSVSLDDVGTVSGVVFHGEVGRRLVLLTGVDLPDASLARPGEVVIRLLPARFKLAQLGSNPDNQLTVQALAEGHRRLAEDGSFTGDLTVASAVQGNVDLIKFTVSAKAQIPLRDQPVTGALTGQVQVGPVFGAVAFGLKQPVERRASVGLVFALGTPKQ